MTPLANHVIVLPHAITNVKGGLYLVQERPQTHTGIISQVSEGIEEVKEGDTVVYLSGAEKWQDGNCIVHLDYVISKI